jgi:excisionase family DNA binding protein
VLLRVERAAFLLDCSADTVYREIADGRIVVRKIRGKTRVHRDDLDAYLREAARRHERGGPPAAASPARLSLRAAGLIDGDEDFGPGPRKGRAGGR